MRLLLASAVAFATIFAMALVGLALDPRVIDGAPVWMKPLKFALSFGVHLASLSVIAAWTRSTSSLFALSVVVVVATSWFEFALIVLQAARGARSHFNVETPFDAAVFTAMGVGVGVLFLASVAAAVALLRHSRELGWPAFVSGLAIAASALGSLTALAMIAPTESQLAGFADGIRVSSGARFPGGGDPGAQIAILGWSLDRGDYRIAHFFGVHALQATLIAGWLLRFAAPGARLVCFLGIVITAAIVTVSLLWIARHDIGLANASALQLTAPALAFALQPVLILAAYLFSPLRGR